MSEGQIAILISIVGLVGPAITAWLSLRTRSEVMEMRRSIEEAIERKYVRKDVYEADHRHLCREQS